MPFVRPAAGRRAIEVLLETEIPKVERDFGVQRLVLVDACAETRGLREEFSLQIGAVTRRVTLTDLDSALGIAEAWRLHRSAQGRDGDGILVVTGTVPADQLGWDLRAHALRNRPLAIDRADIVRQLFGVSDLDARMVGEGWLLDALMQAEPVDGWPKTGGTLTRDRAVRAVLTARLRLGDDTTDTFDVDADTLFSWSRSGHGPSVFAGLPGAERTGLREWLGQAVGPAAPTLLDLVAAGRGADALPLGVLTSAALASPQRDAAGFALGTLFGSALTSYSFDALRPFAEAATGVISRWITDAEGTGPQHSDSYTRVFAVLDRAERLAADSGLSGIVVGDRLLLSGYQGLLSAVAASLTAAPAEAEEALRRLNEHQLALLAAESTETAATAVRLARWLHTPVAAPQSVAQAVAGHLSSSGWVDLAIGILAEGDTSADIRIGEAYHRLIGAVVERRARLDERFAELLAPWTETASQRAPGDALLIENVLTEAAAPLAKDGGKPLILVLDGMSADVAIQLVSQLDRRAWTEVVPKARGGEQPARQAAVSMLPSLTTVSRASLLCGLPTEGGQSVERQGFAAYWKKRHRSAQLFHKGGYEGRPGHRLAPELLQALATDDVVGVVINTIDEALASGREGARYRWSPKDVAKLPDLLNAARDYGRSVVLVSDHGHVLDRTARGHQQTEADGVKGARWRVGVPGEGEVALTGPRVLSGSGRITAAWRDDVRYTSRQAGYHGGASLAEVTVPVITLVPDAELTPSGWTLFPQELAGPGWWRGESDRPAAAEETTAAVTAAPTVPPAPAPASGLGARIVRTPQYRTQREFLRLPPSDRAVVAVLDALIEAGGKLSPSAVAAAAQAATGKSQRNPERFATVLERLFNIDGYPVLQLIESGRTIQLDRTLLEQQFPVAGS